MANLFIALQCFNLAFVSFFLSLAPLYSVRLQSSSLSLNEEQQTFHCKYLYAYIDDDDCGETSGWEACVAPSFRDGSCASIFAQLESTGSYIDLCMVCFTIIFAVAVGTVVLLTLFKYIKEDYFEFVEQTLVTIHLLSAVFGAIVVQQTASILEATKYSNQNGNGLAPELGSATYMLVISPLAMLFFDALYIHFLK